MASVKSATRYLPRELLDETPPTPPPPPCRRVRDLLTENSYQIHSNATKNFCFHSVFPHPECYLLRERRCNDGNIRVTFFSNFREWTRTIRLLPWLFISRLFFLLSIQQFKRQSWLSSSTRHGFKLPRLLSLHSIFVAENCGFPQGLSRSNF